LEHVHFLAETLDIQIDQIGLEHTRHMKKLAFCAESGVPELLLAVSNTIHLFHLLS
jgi:hypothetical protein